jgi:hypothetical protein
VRARRAHRFCKRGPCKPESHIGGGWGMIGGTVAISKNQRLCDDTHHPPPRSPPTLRLTHPPCESPLLHLLVRTALRCRMP